MVTMGTQMPMHSDLGSDCCGFFNDLEETGLYCNECGKEISEVIGEQFRDVKDTLCAMWGHGKERGVFMNFNGCEKEVMEKWLALSKKYGIFGDV